MRPVAHVLLSIATIVSSSCARVTPFTDSVRGPATSCSIAVAGRTMTNDALMAVARSKAGRGRHARIEADMSAPSYRCLGAAIYTLQMAGFTNIETVAAPPATHR